MLLLAYFPTPTIGHSLSVSDDGPGLPKGFDPARSKGLGMKIIATLVKQIGGALLIAPGEEGHGTRDLQSNSRPHSRSEDRAVAPKRRTLLDPKSFLAQVGDGHSVGKYGKGQVVFSQGDTGDAVFYVQKRKVKITVVSEQGKEAVVAILGSDDFFGEGCLAGQMQRISTVTAMTDSGATGKVGCCSSDP
jgi:Cyclic nucleotide-binding domain